MLTEQQANDIRCLYLERNQILAGGEPLPVGCIGSLCGWWRWADTHRVNENGLLVEGLTDIKRNESYGQVTALGYCGMAGKP